MKNQNPQIVPSLNHPYFINRKDLPKYLAKLKWHEEIGIVYFGTPEISGFVLEKLIQFCENPPQNLALHPRGVKSNQIKFNIQAVITAADKLVGRKQQFTPSPVSLIAEKYGIPILKPAVLNNNFIKTHSAFLQAEVYVVVAYGKILPQKLLDIPAFGALNIHPSLLPKYRGASPIQQAILNGDKTTGITVIKMDELLDHGPIIYQEEFSLSDKDTFESLSKEMFQRAADILPKILVNFVQGKTHPRVQNNTLASFCTSVKKQDGYFEISNPPSPQNLDRMVRAYFPWPTAWTKWNGRIVKFLPSSSHPEPIRPEGSRPRRLDSGSKFLIQMEGKKPVPLKAFLHGYPDFPLKKFKLLMRQA